MNTINKGTGAGGCNTNKNGLSYENITNLSNMYTITGSDNKFSIINFVNSDKNFINTKKSLIKYMKIIQKKADICSARGCISPDESYIDANKNTIYIIEKKFQQKPGSVDEKIQTGHFKKQHYKKLFPEFEIVYIYCLSDWFKNGYEPEIEYLKEHNIPIFWGSDENYKQNIINFMIS